MIEILPTDIAFESSPDAGDPECLCSRCLRSIGEEEVPLRAFGEDGSYEFRFCDRCQEALGFIIYRGLDA